MKASQRRGEAVTFDQIITIIGSIVGPALGAVAAYYAIRQDLAVLRVRVDNHGDRLDELHRRADQAHARIDDVLSKG
jgi:orotate phosphoribosyltransferase